MAKILFTAVVADMRNKLNGSVFSKNRYGAYIRTKVTPVNPQTPDQQAARQRLGNLSSSWRSLTQVQRDAWTEAAPNYPVFDIFGNQKILSGQALFVGLNSNLSTVGVSAISSPLSPVGLFPVAISSVAADASDSSIDITFTPTPVPAGFAIAIYATPQLTAGINFYKNRFRLITVVDAAGTSPVDIGADYEARFGNIVAGNKIAVKLVMISKTTGQAGVPVTADTIVVA